MTNAAVALQRLHLEGAEADGAGQQDLRPRWFLVHPFADFINRAVHDCGGFFT